MTAPSFAFAHADLSSRAVIRVAGPDWRSFLHNLLTQDVETMAAGEARFAALLTPQGRLLYDLFVVAGDDGCLLDVEAQHREALLQRLVMYRLRAKVEITASDTSVSALFSAHPREDGDPTGLADGAAPPEGPNSAWIPAFAGMSGWVRDPRLPRLGWRGYGAAETPVEVEQADEAVYDAHRLALGVPGPADWGSDRTYPIEANFDLLNGIDFKKGCFVGQETTSRMKRRGTVKSRMLPIAFEGGPIAPGAEVLAGELRAGEVLSGQAARAMAALRLDRIDGALTAAGRPVQVERPSWFTAALRDDAS